jgi:hypothetical protein
MLQSTENTIKYIEDGVLEHKTRLGELYKNMPRVQTKKDIGDWNPSW